MTSVLSIMGHAPRRMSMKAKMSSSLVHSACCAAPRFSALCIGRSDFVLDLSMYDVFRHCCSGVYLMKVNIIDQAHSQRMSTLLM